MTKLMLNVCRHLHSSTMVFPGGSGGRESACNAGDLGWILRWGRSPGEGKGYPLQHSCLENSMDRGSWQATVHGVAELDTTEQLSLTHLPQKKDRIAYFAILAEHTKYTGELKPIFRSYISSVLFSSVAQLCPTLCDPMNRSTLGLPVHHQLPEFTQTHVH